mmetsp:Transcript_41576/g.49840  ORF Transcript_41576/g.49840 Transcript_41576/m.49840 type:complete len:127 (+) Transcript_41576:200-580(+)
MKQISPTPSPTHRRNLSPAMSAMPENGCSSGNPRFATVGATALVILDINLGINANLEDAEVESLIPQERVHKMYANTDRDTTTSDVLGDIKVVNASTTKSSWMRRRTTVSSGTGLRLKNLMGNKPV